MHKHRQQRWNTLAISSNRFDPSRFATVALLFIPALVAYSLIAYHLNFTQDDAFITFRYVANFLNGHGLVYNIGERIEGFTNFGWTIYLAAWGAFGANYIVVAKTTGFLLGLGSIVVIYLSAFRLLGENSRWYALIPVYLIACNQSLAYWSPAGLETAAFTFLVALGFYQFLIRSRYLPATIMLAVWVRPEGALVAGILIVIEAVLERKFPRYAFGAAVFALMLSLPWLAFKLYYYGSIIPNPFYAKTGLNFDQVKDGLAYVALFFRDYGFLGITWLIPLLSFRKLSNATKAVWLFCVLYTVYLVLVGGDVLKVHRFCLPILGGSATLAAVSLSLLLPQMEGRKKIVAVAVVTAALMGVTWYGPHRDIEYFNSMEKALVASATNKVQQIAKYDKSNFAVASTTIGALGYSILGHDVIDMLGLTDSTVARHAEEIREFASTWKERKSNARYILTRAPDYIMFSTGEKPSAPAEQALMLHAQFLKSYRERVFLYNGVLIAAFKKVRPVDTSRWDLEPTAWVIDYKAGLEAMYSGRVRDAYDIFGRALSEVKGIKPPELLSVMGQCADRMGNTSEAKYLLEEAVQEDSLAAEVHSQLYVASSILGDTADVAIHRQWVLRLTPWAFSWLDSYIAARQSKH